MGLSSNTLKRNSRESSTREACVWSHCPLLQEGNDAIAKARHLTNVTVLPDDWYTIP